MNIEYQNDKDSNWNCFKWCGIAKPRKWQFWNISQRGKNDSLRLPVAVLLCLRIRWKEVILWLWKSRLINMSTKFSTPARPYSGSATRRNNSSAFPIGDQSRGCCSAVWALPARAWCEALSYILGSGGATNDVLSDFTKLVIFMTKRIQGKALYALHREGRKVQCFI